MDTKIKSLVFLVFLLAANIFCKHGIGQAPESTEPVKPGASLIQISKQFIFTEGPAADKNGNIYFTDQPNDKIWEYNTEGKLSLFLEKTGRSNGMYFNNEGLLIACADEKGQLVSIDAGKKIVVLVNNFNGHILNGPNDLWIDKTGGIYFTDPYYQRDYWVRQKPDLDKQSVYYLAKGKSNAMVVDSTLQQPNGIVGTPDGKYLGSDGMTLDEKGNLYLTGKGVTIYSASGKMIENIPVPSGWVGNICFGGKDRTMLFITASESIYTLQMQVKGVE